MKKLIKALPGSVAGRIMRKKIRIREEEASEFSFKIATEREELEQAYRLVHNVYVNTGYADSKPSGMRLNEFYASPNTTTLVGKKGDLVVITLTIFPDSILGLPMDRLYSKELSTFRNKGRNIGEVGALASHPDHRRNNQLLPMMLNKIMYTYARKYLKLDDLVITVNPKHEAVYKNIFLFDQVGENKDYGAVKGHVAVPLRLNLVTLPDLYQEVYGKAPLEKNLHAFYMVNKSECIELPQEKKPMVVWDEDLFHYFFMEKTNLFSPLDRKAQESLSRLYTSSPEGEKLVKGLCNKCNVIRESSKPKKNIDQRHRIPDSLPAKVAS